MACASVDFSGINGACDINRGGIKRIYIANKSDVDAIERNKSNGNIEVITMKEGKKFISWTFRNNTASFTTSSNADNSLGTQGGTATLSLQFTRADNVKRAEIERTLQAEMYVIVETPYTDEDTENGPYCHYFVMGFDTYVTAENVVMQTGTAISDLNGYTIDLVENYYNLPPFIDTSQVTIKDIVDEV